MIRFRVPGAFHDDRRAFQAFFVFFLPSKHGPLRLNRRLGILPYLPNPKNSVASLLGSKVAYPGHWPHHPSCQKYGGGGRPALPPTPKRHLAPSERKIRYFCDHPRGYLWLEVTWGSISRAGDTV